MLKENFIMSKKCIYALLIVMFGGMFGSVGCNVASDDTKIAQMQVERNEDIWGIHSDSPNGKYRAETTGEKEVGGRRYPNTMRVVDLQTEKILWEDSAWLETTFLWSPDSKYLAIGYSGRNWSECNVLDAALWYVIPDLDIQTIQKLADNLPDIYKSGITKVTPIRWLADNTILLGVYWDTIDGHALIGTVQYQVETQKYHELEWELVSVG